MLCLAHPGKRRNSRGTGFVATTGVPNFRDTSQMLLVPNRKRDGFHSQRDNDRSHHEIRPRKHEAARISHLKCQILIFFSLQRNQAARAPICPCNPTDLHSPTPSKLTHSSGLAVRYDRGRRRSVRDREGPAAPLTVPLQCPKPKPTQPHFPSRNAHHTYMQRIGRRHCVSTVN